MKMNKKRALAIILVGVLAVGITYAALEVAFTISNNTVTIGGIGIQVDWLKQGQEAIDTPVTQTQFGTVLPGDIGLAKNPGNGQTCVVFVPNCVGASETITWTTTLDVAVGTISLQQEVYNGTAWNYQTLAPGFVLSGQSAYGLHPGSPVLGDKGHIRVVLTPTANPTKGDYAFSITFTGTQA
jgi:hypothetical protein